MTPSTIVVFGGSSGIGEATAMRLAAAGSQVTIVGGSPGRLAQARARLSDAVRTACVDATDRPAVESFFALLESFDHLVLCQNDAGDAAGPFRSLALDSVRRGIENSLLAQLSVAQAALPGLRPDGSITFVSAGSARVPIPGTAGLAAINAAIEAVVRTLAKELAPLRINAISARVIDTPWWNGMPAQARDAILKQTAEHLPVRRLGTPDDAARVIELLIANTFMTGAVVPVDGGAALV